MPSKIEKSYFLYLEQSRMSKGQPSVAFFLLTLFFILIVYGLKKLDFIQDVKKNWEKVRCRPDIMFFAGLYGFDTAENINFCLSKIFSSRAGATITPFYTFLQSFTGIVLTLLQSINSIRMTFATLVGSVTTVMSNFKDRIQQLFFRIKIAMVRIRFLMNRIYGTLFAMMYMMLSGITAVTNFGNTFLFKFLDTFCFAPETPIEVRGKGIIPIRDVCIGDILEPTGTRVTSCFQFAADGQPMVSLARTDSTMQIEVSANHFIRWEGEWIRSDEHPLSQPCGDWAGGSKRPLICLNTETHEIPIGGHIFCDYDETSDADEPTMNWVLNTLNNTTNSSVNQSYDYTTCILAETTLRKKDGSILSAADVSLGEELKTGTVVGIVKKEVTEVARAAPFLTPGCAVWLDSSQKWERIGEQGVLPLHTPHIAYSYVIFPTAQIELANGLRIRDYVELHTPEAKDIYGSCLRKSMEAV